MASTATGQTTAELKQSEAFLRKSVCDLEAMLLQRNRKIAVLETELKYNKKKWDEADEYVKEYRHNGEDALRKEIYDLMMKNREMQRRNFEQAQKVAVFEQVLDVLHELARHDGSGAERLPVAVGFAMALQKANVDLRKVEVDERRLDVLREFVARGMGSNLPVQPQGEYKGFRSCEAFARMY